MEQFCWHFYIFDDSSDLENLPFLRFCFLLDASIFTITDDSKEKKKINSSNIFEGFYLLSRKKFCKFVNTVDF